MSKVLKGLTIVIAVALLCITAAGCGRVSSKQPGEVPSGQPQGEPVLQSITAYPSELIMDNRGMQQLDIIATYTGGKTENVTAQCTYESSEPNLVTVSEDGYVIGLLPCEAIITIEYTKGDITKKTTLLVIVNFMMP